MGVPIRSIVVFWKSILGSTFMGATISIHQQISQDAQGSWPGVMRGGGWGFMSWGVGIIWLLDLRCRWLWGVDVGLQEGHTWT